MSQPAIPTAAPTAGSVATPRIAVATGDEVPAAGAFTALLAAALGGTPTTSATAALLAAAGLDNVAADAAATDAAATDAAATDAAATDVDAEGLLLEAAADAAGDEPLAAEDVVAALTAALGAVTEAGVPVDAGRTPTAATDRGAEPTTGQPAPAAPDVEVAAEPGMTPVTGSAAPAADAGEVAIRTGDTGTTASPREATEAARRPERAPASAAGDRPVPTTGAADAADVPTASAPSSGAATAANPVTTVDPGPEPGSAVARMVTRVMDAVDMLEKAPPPRRMTVDLPDVDGLRLHIALRGSEVTVTVLAGGPSGDAAGWGRDLTAALADRGFSLGGFGESGEGRRRPNPQQHPDDVAPRTPVRRPRPTTTNDPGLRL